jgi:hypothetical protein
VNLREQAFYAASVCKRLVKPKNDFGHMAQLKPFPQFSLQKTCGAFQANPRFRAVGIPSHFHEKYLRIPEVIAHLDTRNGYDPDARILDLFQ